MDNLYRDFILEHYRNPHNKGVLQPHDLQFADSNPTCGDEMSMTLRLDDAKGAIADVAFDGRGCAISQASASILTDELRGQTLDEVRAIDPQARARRAGRADRSGAPEVRAALLQGAAGRRARRGDRLARRGGGRGMSRSFAGRATACLQSTGRCTGSCAGR